MSKYIIVRTFCDKKDIADKIVNTLLEKKLVAGSQVNEVYAKYWWNNKLEECTEYKLEFRSIKKKFEEIKEVIREIHDYDVCEISACDIVDANKEIFDWIDECVGDNIVSI